MILKGNFVFRKNKIIVRKEPGFFLKRPMIDNAMRFMYTKKDSLLPGTWVEFNSDDSITKNKVVDKRRPNSYIEFKREFPLNITWT